MQLHQSKVSYQRTPDGPRVTYDVLVDGVEYRCTSVELDLLYKGWTPEDLELARIGDAA